MRIVLKEDEKIFSREHDHESSGEIEDEGISAKREGHRTAIPSLVTCRISRKDSFDSASH